CPRKSRVAGPIGRAFSSYSAGARLLIGAHLQRRGLELRRAERAGFFRGILPGHNRNGAAGSTRSEIRRITDGLEEGRATTAAMPLGADVMLAEPGTRRARKTSRSSG